MRARRTLRRCWLHLDPALSPVDQIEDTGGSLDPLNTLFERPLARAAGRPPSRLSGKSHQEW
jgi:hypothetical protein